MDKYTKKNDASTTHHVVSYAIHALGRQGELGSYQNENSDYN